MKKRIIISLIVIILIGVLVVIGIRVYNGKNEYGITSISNKEINMVEKSLKEKYNLNLTMTNCEYKDYGDLGYMAGEHYTFYFEDLDGFEMKATLDYNHLNKENLDKIVLNITNIEKAKELKTFIENNTGMECKILEYRELNGREGYGFKLQLANNANYNIHGSLSGEYKMEDAQDLFVSPTLRDAFSIGDIKGMTLPEIVGHIHVVTAD